MSIIRSVAFAAALATIPAAADAAVTIFKFSGPVYSSYTYQNGSDQYDTYVGKIVTGTFSYDSAAEPTTINGTQAIYNNAVKTSLTTPLGSLAGIGSIEYLHGGGAGGLTDKMNFSIFTAGAVNYIYFSTELPSIASGTPLPAVLDGKTFYLATQNQQNGDDLRANVTIAAAVPEPATWAMMVGGFGLLGASMRRRKLAVRFA